MIIGVDDDGGDVGYNVTEIRGSMSVPSQVSRKESEDWPKMPILLIGKSTNLGMTKIMMMI